MPRRGENIRKRKDGRWEGRIKDGKDINGKTKYKSIYAWSYTELRQAMKKYEKAVKKKGAGNQNISLEKMCSDWLKEIEITVKQSTYARYTFSIEKHILPYFGARSIYELSKADIEEFIKVKTERFRLGQKGGLSPKSIKDLICILTQILKYGERNGFSIGFEYKFLQPSVQRPETQVLTIDEQKRFIKYVKENLNHENVGVLICLYTGIRLGELCALTWKDIDLQSGTLKISKTLQRIPASEGVRKTKIIIDQPKSKNSNRKIPIPAFLLKDLRNLSSRYDTEAYVLTGQKNRFIEPRTYQNKFKKYLKLAQMPDINFHALRHTFATRAVENDFEIKSLSEILGHATVNFTLDRYVHSSEELKKMEMNKMAACYLG